MRASSTSAADRLRGRAIEASCARSASSNINCAFGRPVTIGYLHVTRYPKCKQTMCYEFMGHYTRSLIVDTNVLLDLVENGPVWAYRSQQQLEAASLSLF